MFALDHKRELSGRWAGSGERHHRPDLGRYHSRRPARHRSLGNRAAGRHQYGVGGSALIAMALHAREINPRSAAPGTERGPEIITVT